MQTIDSMFIYHLLAKLSVLAIFFNINKASGFWIKSYLIFSKIALKLQMIFQSFPTPAIMIYNIFNFGTDVLKMSCTTA